MANSYKRSTFPEQQKKFEQAFAKIKDEKKWKNKTLAYEGMVKEATKLVLRTQKKITGYKEGKGLTWENIKDLIKNDILHEIGTENQDEYNEYFNSEKTDFTNKEIDYLINEGVIQAIGCSKEVVQDFINSKTKIKARGFKILCKLLDLPFAEMIERENYQDCYQGADLLYWQLSEFNHSGEKFCLEKIKDQSRCALFWLNHSSSCTYRLKWFLKFFAWSVNHQQPHRVLIIKLEPSQSKSSSANFADNLQPIRDSIIYKLKNLDPESNIDLGKDVNKKSIKTKPDTIPNETVINEILNHLKEKSLILVLDAINYNYFKQFQEKLWEPIARKIYQTSQRGTNYQGYLFLCCLNYEENMPDWSSNLSLIDPRKTPQELDRYNLAKIVTLSLCPNFSDKHLSEWAKSCDNMIDTLKLSRYDYDNDITAMWNETDRGQPVKLLETIYCRSGYSTEWENEHKQRWRQIDGY